MMTTEMCRNVTDVSQMCAKLVAGNNWSSGIMVSVKRAALPLALSAAAATLVAGVAAAGSASRSPTAAPQATRVPSGLHGVLYRGPTTPVCKVNVPCEAPAPGVTLFFTRPGSGLKAISTKTGADGAYRVPLPAAIYTVKTDQRPFGATPHPTRVKVRLDHVDRLDFRIDTGIR